jgi:hypothetical protein
MKWVGEAIDSVNLSVVNMNAGFVMCLRAGCSWGCRLYFPIVIVINHGGGFVFVSIDAAIFVDKIAINDSVHISSVDSDSTIDAITIYGDRFQLATVFALQCGRAG